MYQNIKNVMLSVDMHTHTQAQNTDDKCIKI